MTILVLCISTLSLRIETYRRISRATECTIPSAEIWLPLLLAIYQSLRFQKTLVLEVNEKSKPPVPLWLDRLGRTWVASRFRNLISMGALFLGCDALLTLQAGLNSTYICPIATGEHISVPASQIAGVVLDFILAIIVWEQCRKLPPRRMVVLFSSTMAGVAFIWMLIGAGVYFEVHPYRYYVVLWDVPLLPILSSFVLQALVFSIALISTLHSILVYGVLEMCIPLTAALMLYFNVPFLWRTFDPFPPVSKYVPAWGLVCLYFGWWSYHRLQRSIDQQKEGPWRPKLVLFIGVVILAPLWFKSTIMHYHPIDLLIHEAGIQHEAYVKTVTHDGSLSAAVKVYQERYRRNPPPGFDIWYEYATKRSARIIDEYDQIHEDLLPFYTISPAALRRLTWEIASNQWNEASGVTIRNGTAMVQDNVIPTHRWMIEGVVALINSFASHLPDMDLVFNINDESRVAAPYQIIQELRQQGARAALHGIKSWSHDRAAGWPPESTDFPGHNFRSASFEPNFREWGSISCPPDSPARSDRALIRSKSYLCTSCAAPHSLGQFVSNWSLAADMCHQPDMAHLHGFFMSPAAFKPAYALKPVFSQSKPHGYNDILYPSAWNYMDKVKYEPSDQSKDDHPAYPDPPFDQKENTLFWRGATSEGVSGGGGQWRGMTRQRLVHLVNNGTSHPHDDALVLLPHPHYQGKWEYTRIQGDVVNKILSTDVHVVDHIARCGGDGLHDCTDQETEFAPVGPSDFQAHWKYKYLFDLDGAGFSGRFLPFLQSRSLPFKSALFREWYDSRITAWRHFVPQDYRLHGVWSTLAYFAGFDGTLPNGRSVKWAGHPKQAESIAEEGRAWADQVLRKEDMEIYFFRLLLEWGRLTDDNRDELGFVLNT